jgi:hypothetical protein
LKKKKERRNFFARKNLKRGKRNKHDTNHTTYKKHDSRLTTSQLCDEIAVFLPPILLLAACVRGGLCRV